MLTVFFVSGICWLAVKVNLKIWFLNLILFNVVISYSGSENSLRQDYREKSPNLVCHVSTSHSRGIGGYIKETQRKLRFKKEGVLKSVEKLMKSFLP